VQRTEQFVSRDGHGLKGRTTLAEPVLRADAVHRSEVDAGRSEIRSGHAAGTEAKSYAAAGCMYQGKRIKK
jgi:hypothetical protein